MEKLFTAKINKLGAAFSIVLLTGGLYVVDKRFLGYEVSLLVSGLVGLYLTFGRQGLHDMFSRPQQDFGKTVMKSLFFALIVSFIMAFIWKMLTGQINANPISNNLEGWSGLWEIIKTAPMLAGEEMLTLLPLAIFINIFSDKHHVITIGVVLTSIIFAMLHYWTYQSLVQPLVLLTFSRLIFTRAALKTHTAWASMATHITFDWVTLFLVLFMKTFFK